MKRTVEVCFSDDAVRRGEIDENDPRLDELYALVRKLFGLGRIPLTLTCTIEGVPFVISASILHSSSAAERATRRFDGKWFGYTGA